VARWRIDPKRSRLWVEARSSLHPIDVETNGFEGYAEADTIADPPQIGLPIRVELDAALVQSGNALLDRELERRLEVRKYPRVVGEVSEIKVLDLPAGRYWVRGNLTLHGVTRALDTEMTFRSSEEAIELLGEKVIDMRDFGLAPPRLFIFRVYPEVRVRVRLVASL
jgi:polyisoprenoid-binding protein YceI